LVEKIAKIAAAISCAWICNGAHEIAAGSTAALADAPELLPTTARRLAVSIV